MNLVVFSDVHGNLPALEIMLKDAGKVDGYICLGDSINYGPWSNECVELISKLPNLINIRGNHEEYYIAGKYGGTNATAKAFFDFCYQSFNQYDKISNLVPEYKLNDFTFRHTILNQNIYPDSDIELDNNYVVGHSHHQFTIEQFPFKLYNPGSVGQNRKYINVINYAILETDTMNFESRMHIYDVSVVINEMKVRGYPASCIQYYEEKERLTL